MTTLDELRRANLQEQRGAETVPNAPQTVESGKEELATVVTNLAAPLEAKPVPMKSEKDGVTLDQTSDDPLVAKVRAVVAKKRVHGTGIKATVDMPPDLFWRVKRYCRDHSNATVRQLFLDLMDEFLEAEGY